MADCLFLSLFLPRCARFFLKKTNDTFHPNTLTGYITALCVYCAFFGNSIDNIDVSFVKEMRDEFYTLGNSNYAKILANKDEMKAIALQVEAYCKKYNEI